MTQTYQTGFKTVLATNLALADTTATLATPPTVTKGRMLLKNGNIQEWISFTGVSGSTITGLTRNLSQTADPATGGTGLSWGAGSQIILVAMHDQLPDKLEPTAFPQGVTTTDLSFTSTTTGGLKVKSLTTVQRNALTAANGMIVYDSTIGELYQYIGGAWSAVAAGSTQPNASATVAGKVEIATSAESIAGTDTGGTGALLDVLPSDIAKNTQSGCFVYGTDVGGDDTYVVALTPTLAAYTAGQRLNFKPTTANTGACNVDFGPSVLNIKTKDGNDPQTGVIRANVEISGCYDGTNFVLDTEDFATTANKGIAEMATDAEALAGTDETRYINAKQLADNALLKTQTPFVTGSGNVKYSANTEQTVGEVAYTKKKEIRINVKGTVTVSVEFTGTYAQPGTSKGRVYVNGAAVGDERTDSAFPSGAGYVTYTDTITVAIGDLVQYYISASGTGRGAKCKNFTIGYDKSYLTDGLVITD